MEKLLNTTNSETIYQSLANIIEVPREHILYYIIKNKFKLMDQSVDSINVNHFLKYLSTTTKKDIKTFNFDTLTISHLTTRIESETISTKPLYNLFYALTEETEMNHYLKSLGIVCVRKNKKVEVFYKEKRVKWEDYFDGSNYPAARMVKNRLEGRSDNTVDKCVNGFLFNGKIFENGDVRHIKYMPEILDNMLVVLKVAHKDNTWQKSSSPYIITFISSVNDLVIDEDDKTRLNDKQKCYRILKHCLYYLSRNLFNSWSENDNPKIRLKDELNVDRSKIIDVIKVR